MTSLKRRLLLLGCASVAAWAVCCYAFLHLLNNVSTLIGCFQLAISCFLSFALPSVIIIVFDMYRCNPSETHTNQTLWDHYVIGWYRYITGNRQWSHFRKCSSSAQETQEACLLRILKENKDTKYGNEHAFKLIETTEDFVLQHPLTDYAYYESYLEMIEEGEENVLTPEHIRYLGITSGTTGDGKKFPILRAVVKEMLEVVSMTSYANKGRFPNAFGLQKTLRVTPPLVAKEGPNKLLIGPYSVSVTPKKLETFTTPSICNDISDESALTYIHALFGLQEGDLRTVSFLYPSVAYRFIATLEKLWKSLCEDIAKGTLRRQLDISQEIREHLEGLLTPNPKRADEARAELRCCQTNIFRRLWPNLEVIELFSSGTLQGAAIGLKRRYFGDVKVASTYHAATEGFYGSNLDPKDMHCPIYTALICHTFYEFIPMNEVRKENPTTLQIEDEPEVGKEYELVVTTNRCLYRYRTGDIIKITGYFDEIPQYQFMYRLDQTINLVGETTTEWLVQRAVLNSLEKLQHFTLVDYTMTTSDRITQSPDLDSEGSDSDDVESYVLFIELRLQPHVGKQEKLSEDEKLLFEEALKDVSDEYRILRGDNKLGQLRVVQLNKWAFLYLKDFLREMEPDMAVAQYKTPKYAKQQHVVDFLVGQELQNNIG